MFIELALIGITSAAALCPYSHEASVSTSGPGLFFSSLFNLFIWNHETKRKLNSSVILYCMFDYI